MIDGVDENHPENLCDAGNYLVILCDVDVTRLENLDGDGNYVESLNDDGIHGDAVNHPLNETDDENLDDAGNYVLNGSDDGISTLIFFSSEISSSIASPDDAVILIFGVPLASPLPPLQ